MCQYVNSLGPGRFKVNFRWVIFKLILMVNGWGISCETAFIWVSLGNTYDKSTFVQVMAWCLRQQASTWANVDLDLCRHMASLGHNELMHFCSKGVENEINFTPIFKDVKCIANDGGCVDILIKCCSKVVDIGIEYNTHILGYIMHHKWGQELWDIKDLWDVCDYRNLHDTAEL